MKTATNSPTCQRSARRSLLEQYGEVLEVNPRLDRKLVSHQGNRQHSFYNWLKYKEAYSASLVEHFLGLFGTEDGTLLDPFAGIGTSLFCAQSFGMNSIGIELMPVGFQLGLSRMAAAEIDPALFARKIAEVSSINWRDYYDTSYDFAHIPITDGAFPPDTETALAGYRAYCARHIRNPSLRALFTLAGMAILESVSFTRKDGQYLRWDCRADKPRATSQFDKGRVLSFDEAIQNRLKAYLADIQASRGSNGLFERNGDSSGHATLDFRQGSCLEQLPQIPSESVDLVVTSPPYCNRYDYTRTYALELVYLGLDADDVKQLRQRLLSCTVENRDKVQELTARYEGCGLGDRFRRIMQTFEDQRALQEVLKYLEMQGNRGLLNNANIPRMVKNYFLEMCFVVFELARLLRPGGHVVMVNDNVRYSGEEVPVDLILSDFAQEFGLTVKHIWVLPRGKGNSSQQMGSHGRVELRKCVYVWSKEC